MPPNIETSVCIVIVNYRTPDLTVDCLRSLVPERELVPGMRVIVTDNQSPDDSVAKLTAAIRENGWGKWVELMPLERNGGFSYGNNEAIRRVMAGANPPEFIHLLNPDTIVHPGGVKELAEFLRGHPAVGIAGSLLEEVDGRLQASAYRFHSVFGEIDFGLKLGVVTKLLSRWVVAPSPPAEASRTGWVSGASLMVRRSVLEQVGLLDEKYFMYYEETDLCLRATRAGWEVWYVPASRIVHFQKQSQGGTAPKRVPTYWFDSRRRYFVKNLGVAHALAADAAHGVCFATWRVRRAIQRKPDVDPPHYLADFCKNSVFAKGFKC